MAPKLDFGCCRCTPWAVETYCKGYGNCVFERCSIKPALKRLLLIKKCRIIAAAVSKDSVIIGATSFDPNHLEVAYLAQNVFCTTIGQNTELKRVCGRLRLRFEQYCRITRCDVVPLWVARMETACFQDKIQTPFLVGCVDDCGPHLFYVNKTDSKCELPFVVEGPANDCCRFQAQFRPYMCENGAKQLVYQVIVDNFYRATCCLPRVDLFVVRKHSNEILRCFNEAKDELPMNTLPSECNYSFAHRPQFCPP